MLKKKIMDKFLNTWNKQRIIFKMNIILFKPWINNNKRSKRVEGIFDKFRVMLSENEVNELRNGLKAKWVEITKKY
jgi:sRNA-binding regulator protein Hfq